MKWAYFSEIKNIENNEKKKKGTREDKVENVISEKARETTSNVSCKCKM